MNILRFTVHDNFDLVLFGDDQEGNVLKHRDGYQETIEYILEKKNRFALHMGDEMEGFWIDDPRYTVETITHDPLSQQRSVLSELQPLADEGRLISILYGNHTHKLLPKIGNITKDTCEKLGVPYLGFATVIEFADHLGVQWKGFFMHGRRTIRSIADDPIRRAANEKLQLKQSLKNKMGDCILQAMGHSHRLIISPPERNLYLTTDNDDIKQHYTGHIGAKYIHPDSRWYINTGSYLRTFGMGVTSYSELGGYDPIELGCAVVHIRDRQIVDATKKTV